MHACGMYSKYANDLSCLCLFGWYDLTCDERGGRVPDLLLLYFVYEEYLIIKWEEEEAETGN